MVLRDAQKLFIHIECVHDLIDVIWRNQSARAKRNRIGLVRLSAIHSSMCDPHANVSASQPAFCFMPELMCLWATQSCACRAYQSQTAEYGIRNPESLAHVPEHTPTAQHSTATHTLNRIK